MPALAFCFAISAIVMLFGVDVVDFLIEVPCSKELNASPLDGLPMVVILLVLVLVLVLAPNTVDGSCLAAAIGTEVK